MNNLKLITLLGFLMIFSGGSAWAQTAIGTANAGAVMGVSGFSGREVNKPARSGGAFSQSERGAAFEVGVENGSVPSVTRYQTGFSVRPGGTPPPATGPVTTSIPGTNSVGTFSSGQSTVTNPSNPIVERSPGTTTVVLGQTGETSASTPGTSGTTGGTVPGTTITSPLTPIPGTQSIGTFGSGQTIVTNPGNSFTVAPPGTTTIVQGQTGETSASTPGTSGTTGGTVPGTTTTSPLTPIPGTQSIGSFGSGQTIVTNPGNPFTVAPPGTTTIVQGQTGETGAVTLGTSGTTGGTVPGTITTNTLTPIPGTQSIGSFGSGQTIVTNPGNPITVTPPGRTSIVVGQTGGTNAVTPGTSGIPQTGGTVPGGVFPGTTATIASASSAIPGTQSIGVFASGQTIVTNPGNPITVAPSGTTSTVVGPSGETSAVTPGTTGLSSPVTTGPGTFGSTTPTPSASAFGALTPGTFGAAVTGVFGGNAATTGTFGPNVGRR